MNTRWSYTRRDGKQRTLTVLPAAIVDAKRTGAKWHPDMRTQFGPQCSHGNMMQIRESAEWRIAVIDYARLHGLNEEALQLSMCKKARRARSAGARVSEMMEQFSERKFGIELEVVSKKTRRQICNLLQAAGVQCYVGYYDDPIDGAWKVGTDGSIRKPASQERRGFKYAMEIVSPPLRGDAGLAEVKKVTDALKGIVTANRTCGMHCHIDMAGITVNQLRNVCTAWLNNEHAVNQLIPASRRNNRYCRNNEPAADRTYVSRARTLNRLKMLMQNGRYYKLNLYAMDRHGTVEFRYHSGTAATEKVTRQIQFCMAFVERHLDADITVQEPADEHAQLMQIAAALPRQMQAGFNRYWQQRRRQYAA